MKRFPLFRALLIIAALACAASFQSCRATDELSPEQSDFFEAKIRPVLVAHCYECHSGDSKVPKGGLRLDLRETTRAGGDSGEAVIPGKPEESLLLSALNYESFEMPPRGRLPDAVIRDFEDWIGMGAPDPRTHSASKSKEAIDYSSALEFWAFRVPVRPAPPAVQDRMWPQNEIDQFVLHRLEQQGMRPAAPAGRRTLIRRAYFDLLGLPPDPEFVERFVNDPSDTAFENAVNDLLASPHYGERWGRYWLDLARFAEDQAHTFKARMYPQGYIYRDWVVRALNNDMPYDDFLRLQIAGDQIDVDDSWQHRAALGLFALGPVYYQDNGEQDKALADEWDDRIDTLMRGTQALTVSCARCHDHKYDPISMADYYGLAGIFASSDYRELPAVSDSVVEARRQADQAVNAQELGISSLLAQHAPAARLKLTSSIPHYLQAAAKLLRSSQGAKPEKQRIEKVADEAKLNRELLRRWVAWLKEEPDSGAIGAERPWLAAWREWQSSLKNGNSASETDQAAAVTRIAAQLQSDVESLLPQRQKLLQRFGDNMAFVAASDRAVIDPGTIPLGNLFDDKKGAFLPAALSTDPFRATATADSSGVERIAQGWGGSTQIAAGVHFDFRSLGSDSRQHGQITNDAWSAEGGIRTQGSKCASSLGRTEQGIGMHANALVTFDLDEIRRAGLIPASTEMRLLVDRAGINDDAFGAGASVHIAVIVSKPHEKSGTYDAVISGFVDGQPATVAENDTVYYFDGELPPAIRADGKFVSFDVSVPPEARYLTLATTGAQISETENTISSDHAVLSGARLTYDAVAPGSQLADDSDSPEELTEDQLEELSQNATLLSEMFDERGVLGLPADQTGPLLDGEAAAELSAMTAELDVRRKAAAAIVVTMAHSLNDGGARDLPIYLAGDPKKKGEPAARSFPAILTAGQRQPFKPQGSGRRELAECIASAKNPLTARVMANRIWAGHFGVGLVRTLSNFGQLGDRPSHPELLDYLAVELMQSGWSLKHLHRRIMQSATWQQSSSGDAAYEAVDPENRLLWRMNRRRLEVEPWRDAVLSVSGQLNRTVGGPSSELDGTHSRRTLYGFVSRHRLNDLLRLFDFPDPNITSGERSVTTVPLQQLFVLNSDFMIGQSKALAARLQHDVATDDARIDLAFALLFSRPPSEEERSFGMAFLNSATAQPGDSLTPLEQYCLAMLGTNEFLFVD